MIRGFRDFIMRGNVVDLAVAVVIGAAFGSIVSAFSDRVVKPLIAAAGGSESMNGLGFSIRNGNPEIAKTTFVDIGSVISAFINFLIIAAVVYFVIVVPMNRLAEMRKRGEAPEPRAPAEDILLLQEIRDLLKAQSGRREA